MWRNMGNTKARVLPLPVLAMPIQSLRVCAHIHARYIHMLIHALALSHVHIYTQKIQDCVQESRAYVHSNTCTRTYTQGHKGGAAICAQCSGMAGIMAIITA